MRNPGVFFCLKQQGQGGRLFFLIAMRPNAEDCNTYRGKKKKKKGKEQPALSTEVVESFNVAFLSPWGHCNVRRSLNEMLEGGGGLPGCY